MFQKQKQKQKTGKCPEKDLNGIDKEFKLVVIKSLPISGDEWINTARTSIKRQKI